MSSHLTVVYDACVLYPAPLRDLLLRLALKDRFRARWSNAIHDEWIHNLLKQRPELDRTTLEKTRALMDSNVRDSLVEDFEHLVLPLNYLTLVIDMWWPQPFTVALISLLPSISRIFQLAPWTATTWELSILMTSLLICSIFTLPQFYKHSLSNGLL